MTDVLALVCEVVFQAGRHFGSWGGGADCVSLLQSDQGRLEEGWPGGGGGGVLSPSSL